MLLGLAFVAILLAGDWALSLWVVRRIETGLGRFCGGNRAAEVSMSAVPFLPRLVFSSIPELHVRMEDVEGQGYSFGSFEGDLRGVEVNRSDLLSGKVDVRAVRSGRLQLAGSSGGSFDLRAVDVVFSHGRATADLHTGLGTVPFEGPYELGDRKLTFRLERDGRVTNTIVFTFPEEDDDCVTSESDPTG